MPQHEDKRGCSAKKLRSAEQAEVEERPFGWCFQCTTVQIEAERGNRRFDLDFDRTEPVLLFAAVEEQLQRADAGGEK